MKYPLSDTEQYAGKIIFQPVAEEYIDVAKSGKDAISGLGEGLSRFTNSNGELDAFGGSGITSTKFVKNSRQGVSGAMTLYLPQAINVSDQVTYGRMDLGAIGAVANAAISSGQSPIEAAKTALGQAGKSFADLYRNGAFSSELAALAAVRLSPNGVASGVAKSQLGVAVNPNTKSLFQDVQLRTFGFNFKMIASSAAEANAIEQIIKTFRTELYPETINYTAEDNSFSAPLGYKFPNKFRVILQYNGIELPIKFLPSNLISVQAVYNPSSMGWHANGKPSEVDLTLQFGEPRTLSKQDIRDGY